jgi:hypothetical protein
MWGTFTQQRMRNEEEIWSGISGYQWDDERLSLALGGDCIFISPSCLRPQSFLWSTDMLVLVPSFRPSHAPWATRCGLEHFSIWYDLEQPWPVYFHRLRSCKFSMGASAGWQRGQ